MKQKINTTTRAILSNYRNDAVKGTYKYWRETLQDDVYNLGMSHEEVKTKYSYGSYKPYWLSTKYWKKRFDAGYEYWVAKRQADKNTGTYSGSDTRDENTTVASKTTTYLIYGLIAVLAIFIIWGIIKKRKKS